mmetsp:Transcript_84651/g.229729  ORF Transcript_84651/g.229729 Transcript_84651/m.229729 type:complete len:291 (-) Transcript_84651:71-943(-)
MPRKKPSNLPSVNAGPSFSGDGVWRQHAAMRSMESDPHESLQMAFEQSDFSTCLPTSLSPEDMRSLSEVLDKSMQNPSMLGLMGKDMNASKWEVQSKDDIIKEVRQHVHAQKPWREHIVDIDFDRRRAHERQERMDRGFLIIMPDNRVRAMDTMISARVRAQIFDDEEEPDLASSSRRGFSARRRKERLAPEDNKPKGPRRPRNPWYLPPSSWHSKQSAKDMGDGETGRFPYDTEILRNQGVLGGAHGDREDDVDESRPPKVSELEKESLQIVEAYKQHMKGSRLPHFLL